MIGRLAGIDRRKKVFLVLGVVILVLAATGFLSSRRDVHIERDEAIEIARPQIDFEPEIAEAKLIRQGFSRRPVWAVTFAIPQPGGGRDDFARKVSVQVDAGDGTIIEVITDD